MARFSMSVKMCGCLVGLNYDKSVGARYLRRSISLAVCKGSENAGQHDVCRESGGIKCRDWSWEK